MDKYADGEIGGDEPSLTSEAKGMRSKNNEQCYFLDEDMKNCLFFNEIWKIKGKEERYCMGYSSTELLLHWPDKFATEYEYQENIAKHCIAHCNTPDESKKIVEEFKKGLEKLTTYIEEKRLNKC